MCLRLVDGERVVSEVMYDVCSFASFVCDGERLLGFLGLLVISFVSWRSASLSKDLCASLVQYQRLLTMLTIYHLLVISLLFGKNKNTLIKDQK